MPELVIRECEAKDSDALCRLVDRVSMGQRIRLVFDRTPDYFIGAGVQAEAQLTLGCFRFDGEAVGLFTVGSRKVYLNGGIQLVSYLSDLRIHPAYRGGRLLFKGFVELSSLIGLDEVLQTLVLEDNVDALKLLTSGRANLPKYNPAGRYKTFFLPTGKFVFRSGKLDVRRAMPEDVPLMQTLYDEESMKRAYSPVYDFSKVDASGYYFGLRLSDFMLATINGEVLAMLGLWNQSGFKRIRVTGYSKVLKCSRPFVNLFCRVKLPQVGEEIPTISATGIAVKDGNPWLFNQLLRGVLAEIPKGRVLALGFDESDPLVAGVDGLSARCEYGRHYLVSFGAKEVKAPELFAFDLARI